MFHIRASYRLPSLSFCGNQVSHSRDTIWHWRSKVKVKDSPVSAPSSWLISLVFHIRSSYRPWPKVNHVWLEELASGVFPESWKVLAERRPWRRQRKQTKNKKSPGYPGWLNNYMALICSVFAINVCHISIMFFQRSMPVIWQSLIWQQYSEPMTGWRKRHGFCKHRSYLFPWMKPAISPWVNMSVSQGAFSWISAREWQRHRQIVAGFGRHGGGRL